MTRPTVVMTAQDYFAEAIRDAVTVAYQDSCTPADVQRILAEAFVRVSREAGESLTVAIERLQAAWSGVPSPSRHNPPAPVVTHGPPPGATPAPRLELNHVLDAAGKAAAIWTRGHVDPGLLQTQAMVAWAGKGEEFVVAPVTHEWWLLEPPPPGAAYGVRVRKSEADVPGTIPVSVWSPREWER